MSTDCMKSQYNGDCCCNCKNHYEDFYHCTTEEIEAGVAIIDKLIELEQIELSHYVGDKDWCIKFKIDDLKRLRRNIENDCRLIIPDREGGYNAYAITGVLKDGQLVVKFHQSVGR